ncbi:dol-P-Man:Man(7)GlcNAc(2)-PP-Dol alpha-1,6-mannosyltransferase-like [Dreissena polymorpha]|nr:dol-P-Man:Man(7)GlcNAc(2)-PP-Dol alpha-1,6-mannosyltransferase-like [Dreissena polymorpha]XP_052282964.1 dol-P-Man:Man(7)GlcNAc(2)-PP-Dol alpha-1,6-mannosyltransferase-like [Dreissena polymorpha]XP_052282974.1 dol-P-Man:Man(7)GlcNAc(2)-PP-Dol alpha-1,6-mannosyltransferase-like [Dreissena polymorpha]
MFTSGLELLLVTVMIVHVIMCPYTKVEESFNMQAMHDVLYHTTNISQYDHLQFPGVVPRTFLGPLFVAVSSSPLVMVTQLLGMSKFTSQYIVRFALGNLVMLGLFMFAQAVRDIFGRPTAKLFLVITASQFHFMFYMTRSLPNTFALVLVLFALRAWLRQRHMLFIWLSGAAILIFRSELAIFLGILLLMHLINGRVSIVTVVKTIIPAGILLLGLPVVVDSYFWQRLLWPEGEVLFYNTVLNKSSNWGTSPFLWYFYSAIPRAMSCSIFLVPVGLIVSPRLTQLVVPALAFVFLYSFLPHKELRFIIYVIPVLNVAAAEACHRLWISKSKSYLQALLALLAVLHIAGNITTTSVFMYTSHSNYPGGVALARLHELEPSASDVHVHIDVAAAQSGITRFGQLHDHWIYNKTEDLTPGGSEMQSFTHLIIGEPDHLEFYQKTHTILDEILGFERLQMKTDAVPFFFFQHKAKMWILKRN